MLHYYKFRQDLFDPVAAKEVYDKPGPGRGRPEECPPIRAACSFGFDVLANFDVTFVRGRDKNWRVKEPVVLSSDFDWAPHEDSQGVPLTQEYAWFWEKGQTIPHVITDNVYELIKHQVKISTFLFIKTDPNEMLLMTDVPNRKRPWKVMTALVETDWYPASYPWHSVIELDPAEKQITINKGEVICRMIPVRRDTYFAQQMTPASFDEFFTRGQHWLATHGKFAHDTTVDITRTYVRQQARSRFVVMG